MNEKSGTGSPHREWTDDVGLRCNTIRNLMASVTRHFQQSVSAHQLNVHTAHFRSTSQDIPLLTVLLMTAVCLGLPPYAVKQMGRPTSSQLWSPSTEGACPLHGRNGCAEGGCERGSPPPIVGVWSTGVISRKILKFYVRIPAF